MSTATKDTGRERLARVGLAPRGLDRLEAAAYIGISPGTFDKLVADGRMPAAKQLAGRLVWDRLQLDRSFEALPDAAGRPGAPSADDDRWSAAL